MFIDFCQIRKDLDDCTCPHGLKRDRHAILWLQGADVNGGDHEHGYTSLHFAALANKPNVCKLLLEKGVKIDEVNSVKRTAAQMGAFVGNHECVAVINNYVPKEDIFYYTRKQPFEEKAKLPLKMATPLHNLVMLVLFHFPFKHSWLFCHFPAHGKI